MSLGVNGVWAVKALTGGKSAILMAKITTTAKPILDLTRDRAATFSLPQNY
jgi:hypothetical protein